MFPRSKGMMGRPQGSGDKRSRSQEAEVMFGSLAETSFSIPWVEWIEACSERRKRCLWKVLLRIVLNSILPRWPIKQYMPVTLTSCFATLVQSPTACRTLYVLTLPTFYLLLVVTSHLILEVFARQLLLSGIVSPLTSVLPKLTTVRRHLKSHLFHSAFATA